jgi:hypothetical protein
MMSFRNSFGPVRPGSPARGGGSVGLAPVQQTGGMPSAQSGVPPQVNRSQLSPTTSYQRPFSMIGNPGMRAQFQTPSF